jgi:hypothetical protein
MTPTPRYIIVLVDDFFATGRARTRTGARTRTPCEGDDSDSPNRPRPRRRGRSRFLHHRQSEGEGEGEGEDDHGNPVRAEPPKCQDKGRLGWFLPRTPTQAYATADSWGVTPWASATREAPAKAELRPTIAGATTCSLSQQETSIGLSSQRPSIVGRRMLWVDRPDFEEQATV